MTTENRSLIIQRTLRSSLNRLELSPGYRRLRAITAIIIYTGCMISCDTKSNTTASATSTATTPSLKIVKSIPHDPKAFTQGLVYYNNILVEGTGMNGTSWISELEPSTLQYEKKVHVPNDYFGEGLTILNDKIYQLTYKRRVGFIYDVKSYELISQFEYPSKIKEGWGITHDDHHLIISDGSSQLHYLDTSSFQISRSIQVQQNGKPVSRLNELEYINDYIYSNVWEAPYILKIAPATGAVIDQIDLSNIVHMAKNRNPKIDVLNGIAYDPMNRHLIVTGKYWSDLYFISYESLVQ